MHPPYVTVGDVMHPAVITLRENMLLRLAVRIFVNTGLHAAPVMEAETARSCGYKRTQRTHMSCNQPIATLAYVRLTATRRAQLMRELRTIRHHATCGPRLLEELTVVACCGTCCCGPRLLEELTVVACVAGQARGCYHSDGYALPVQPRCRKGPLPLAGARLPAHTGVKALLSSAHVFRYYPVICTQLS
jgi:hypothetical protein